jgi:hypothetical protein
MIQLHLRFRTIAIAFSVSLFALLATITPVNAGGVTNIKEVVNNTRRFSIEVRKVMDQQTLSASDGSETTGVVLPGRPWRGNLWIPWADNSNDFPYHNIELRTSTSRFGNPLSWPWVSWRWIWQSGDFVRYNTRARFVPNGNRVPGEARSGGERRLLFYLSGNDIAFTFQEL